MPHVRTTLHGFPISSPRGAVEFGKLWVSGVYIYNPWSNSNIILAFLSLVPSTVFTELRSLSSENAGFDLMVSHKNLRAFHRNAAEKRRAPSPDLLAVVAKWPLTMPLSAEPLVFW